MDVHIVSHTHWDREWYLTYEQFRLRLVGLIDRLLDLLESQPDFAFFHLDGQTIVLEDYLELRPQQEPRLRKLIADGRILIGPWYDMPDEFLVSGEALVRNLARGHRVARRFGAPMPVGYLPDLFGHVAQMPQILRHFGLDNAVLWRGFGGRNAEYWWDAPDGSRVLMMHLPPEGYCNATRVHFRPEAMVERTTAVIEKEAARTSVGVVLLMNGVDHVEPHPVIPSLARRVSQALGVPVRHSTLPAYVEAVRTAVHAAGKSLEVVRGELRGGEDYANLLPGVFSARVYIKQANARVQTLLEKRAEPLATFASMLGASYPQQELAYAWKTLLHNHPHDSICGCSVDAVHDENMTRFARAEQVAHAVVDQAASVIARAVPGAPAGAMRIVALNTMGVGHKGAIEATIDLPYADAEPRRPDVEALDAPVTLWSKGARVTAVATHDGKPVPLQVLSEESVITWVMSRYETPWGLHARRVKLLLNGTVPACGYATFDLAISESAPANVRPLKSPLVCSDRSAENEHLRLSINDDGTVDIVDRKTSTRYQRCGEFEDVADAGDEYNYSPPKTDRRITSSEARHVRVTRIHAGAVRAAFRIEVNLRVPASLSADRSARSSDLVDSSVVTVVSLDADSRRVGWEVSVDNRAKDHRLRILFPVGAPSIAHVRAETAFGVVTRPARREVPSEVRMEVPVSYGPTGWFTEAGNEQCGAIVFGEGLAEYEAYTDGDEPRLALTLLRAVEYLSRDDLTMRPSGHAGPGLFTPGAQCLGRHQFRLAFEPRKERPAASALFARAASFVAPPHVVPAIGAGGSRPPVDAFVKTEAAQGGVVLSACHRAEESERTLLRFFNPDETPASVVVRTSAPLSEAVHVNFLEEPLGEVRVRNDAAIVQLAPHGIATVLVK